MLSCPPCEVSRHPFFLFREYCFLFFSFFQYRRFFLGVFRVISSGVGVVRLHEVNDGALIAVSPQASPKALDPGREEARLREPSEGGQHLKQAHLHVEKEGGEYDERKGSAMKKKVSTMKKKGRIR